MTKPRNSLSVSLRPSPTLARRLFLLFLCHAVATGCGSHHRIVQLQSENERLLAEFRSQRDQNRDLSQKNTILEARVAESEKMLAQLNNSSKGRLSMLERGTQTGSSLPLPNTSLPSGPGASSNLGEANSSLQWKPVRK